MDGKALNNHTPIVAQRTLPGTYTLKLTKDDYTSWERQIEIKSRQTTVVEGATLFLQTEPVSTQAISATISAAANDGSAVAYLVKSGPWMELWLYDLGNQRLTLLDRLSAKETPQPTLHFTHDDYLLILDDAVAGDAHRRYYTVDGALETAPNWFAEYAFLGDGEAETLVRLLSSGPPIARLSEGDYQIDDVFGNLLLVRDRGRGQMLLIDTATSGPPILINIAADWARFDGDHLYLSDGFELHRFDITSGTDTLITRASARMDNVVPYPNSETILLVGQTNVMASDVADQSHPVNTPLFSADVIQSFWIDSRGKFGYAIATVNGVSGLYQIALAK